MSPLTPEEMQVAIEKTISDIGEMYLITNPTEAEAAIIAAYPEIEVKIVGRCVMVRMPVPMEEITITIVKAE